MKPAPAKTAKRAPHVLVICGSMSHHASMQLLAFRLKSKGIEVVTPADERLAAGADRTALKARLSLKYFRLIRRWEVFAILVANDPKGRKPNYIGPNTFAEIVIAVNARKKIFLLHDFYPALKDELVAWGAVPLRGNLGTLLRALPVA